MVDRSYVIFVFFSKYFLISFIEIIAERFLSLVHPQTLRPGAFPLLASLLRHYAQEI